MTCPEVQSMLPDRMAGVVPTGALHRIERHLARCPECQIERAALEEGFSTLGLALTPVDPPPNLGERIVGRVAAARREKVGRTRGVRALAASTLAAALVAVGALGWAVAERGHGRQAQAQVEKVTGLIKALQAVGARPFRAELLPARQQKKGFGSVAIYSATRVNDFILVGVVLPDDRTGPYTVKVTDRNGRVLSRGRLSKTNNGDWVFYESTTANLSKAISVSVMDRSARAVIVGSIQPAALDGDSG